MERLTSRICSLIPMQIFLGTDPINHKEVHYHKYRGGLQAFCDSSEHVLKTFNHVHNIQADVPAENIRALFDAAYEFGFYD